MTGSVSSDSYAIRLIVLDGLLPCRALQLAQSEPSEPPTSPRHCPFTTEFPSFDAHLLAQFSHHWRGHGLVVTLGHSPQWSSNHGHRRDQCRRQRRPCLPRHSIRRGSCRRKKQATLKPVTGDVNATTYGSICYYADTLHPVSARLPPSEDCLFLNVFKPADATSDSKLPVLVWIHGGAFISGTSNTEEGTNLVAAAKEKAIVVNLNYRLGVFGFLSNTEILSEGDGANFGLRDQEVAFQWVKQYIEFFGGDPEQITAFGESAGAVSIALHMLSRDGDQQLFKQGILQSGAHLPSHHMITPDTQQQQVLAIAQSVGCNESEKTLDCLRRTNASAIFAAGVTLNWFPVVDGKFLKEMPIQRVLAGKVSRVPTIIGTNTDEGWIFAFGAAEASQYDTFVRTTFARLTEQEYERLGELYPASAFATPQHRTGELFGDMTFAYFGRSGASTPASRLAPTYHYRFNYTSTEYGYPLAVHTKDIAYVFNLVNALPSDEDTKAVVGYMQHYWTNFAITGSPNGQGQIEGSEILPWPKYDAAKKQVVIQPKLGLETNGEYPPGHAERCAFWSEVENRIIQEVQFA